MAKQTDFMSAVNQIAAERGIPSEEVLLAIETAIKTGFKHDYGMGESLVVNINPDKGVIGVFADKKVVDEVTTVATQISLKDAQKIESKLKVGDHVQVDITPEGDFGRIAAQAAKQVILQKIRESEKDAVMSEVKDKIGEIENGIVQRMEGDAVIVEVRKANAVMPFEERVPREFYKSGSQIKILLKEIRKGPKGKTLIVSRAAPEFLGELFAIEIPEIMSGSVEIMGIAREAGSRSKIAVRSNQPGVDPIGSCVGQRGVRINTIMDELKGEKIDIIVWHEDVRQYIGNALSPAEVDSIQIDEEHQTAIVTVPDDQLSLAIGKDGQNVRLAAKLTNWKIDIKGVNEGKVPEGEADPTEETATKADTETPVESTQEPNEEQPGEASKDTETTDEVTSKSAEKQEDVVVDDTSSNDDPFVQFEFSKRVHDALVKSGLTIDQVREHKANGTLEDIKGIGKKAAEEISSKLS